MLNNEYDPFARLYNRHWGNEYRAEAFPLMERLLLSRLKPRAQLLDVCCGTGQFDALLTAADYKVTGIDASAAMLNYARVNAPQAEFLVADVRDFSLGRKFDAAFSVFESLNHVPDVGGLEAAFRNIRGHLRRGAPFLFDMNREEAFDLFWNTTESIVTDEMVCLLRMEYDPGARRASCAVTEFNRSGALWDRTDYTLRQTCHDHDDVQDILREIGFRGVTLYHGRDAGMRGDAGFGRVFFLAEA